MAVVTISVESTLEDDGVDSQLTMTRNVEDLYELAHLYCDAARAMGYTYVQDVAFEKESGEVTFGERW